MEIRSELKVIVLGDCGVGKTSLLHRLVRNKFDDEFRYTIICDFLRKKIEIDGKEYTLVLWDSAGQERFLSTFNASYYRNTCCCVFVFAIDNLESFNGLEKWKDQFLDHLKSNSKENFPFILVGNKLDLDDQRQVETEKAKSWCTQNGAMPYMETSAKDGRGVFEAFEMVARRFSTLSHDEQTSLLTIHSMLPDTTNNGNSCC